MVQTEQDTSGATRPARTAAWWIRQTHFYTSLALAGLFVFCATTGFIASRSDLFDRNERPVLKAKGTLPESLSLDAGALSTWLSRHFPGRLLEKTLKEDDSLIRFEMESVWSWHEVTVDRETRTYVVNTTPSSWASSLIGLHRGKWAGPAQRLIVDATALALIVATCTGICIGVTHPIRTKRWVAIVLVTGSILLGLLLCLSR